MTSRLPKYLSAVVALLVCVASAGPTAFAGETKPQPSEAPVHPRGWAYVGGGVGDSDQFASDFSHAIGVGYQPIRWMTVGVRRTVSDTVCLFGSSCPDTGDVAAMVGLSPTDEFFTTSLLVGPGYVTGQDNDNHDYSAWGLAVEGQAFIDPTPNFGFGVVLQSNYNSQNSFMSVLGAIRLGVLR